MNHDCLLALLKVWKKVSLEETQSDFVIDFQYKELATLFSINDRDRRRRALEIAVLAAQIYAPSNHLFESGLYDYIESLHSQESNTKETFEQWWSVRTSIPTCEFMLAACERRDLTCLKFAGLLALQIDSETLYEHILTKFPKCMMRVKTLFDIYGDHDSLLLKSLNALIHTENLVPLLAIGKEEFVFTLLLAFLDYVDFDDTTIMDLILSDPELALVYLQNTIQIVLDTPDHFKAVCFRQAELSKATWSDTDYLASTLATLKDLSKTLAHIALPPSTPLVALLISLSALFEKLPKST